LEVSAATKKSAGIGEFVGKRLFVMANTALAPRSFMFTSGHPLSAGPDEENDMSFNATRIATYVGHLFDAVENRSIAEISQTLRPDPACRCLNRPCELSELMCQTFTRGYQKGI
jgi:hypothetical protein